MIIKDNQEFKKQGIVMRKMCEYRIQMNLNGLKQQIVFVVSIIESTICIICQ